MTDARLILEQLDDQSEKAKRGWTATVCIRLITTKRPKLGLVALPYGDTIALESSSFSKCNLI